MWKWVYIRWLGRSHFHCYAWQKQRGLAVAAACVPEEAKQRSLSEQLSTDGTLDPKTFSIWTVTHSYDTARGMPSWVLHNTVETFSQLAHSLEAENISSTENLFNKFTKKTKTNKLLMLATYTVLSVAPILPHVSTSHTYTALAILTTSYCIPASGLWNMYPCVDLCLHTTWLNWSRRGLHTHVQSLACVLAHKWPACVTELVMHIMCLGHFSMQH